jgi:hypothetical protein
MLTIHEREKALILFALRYLISNADDANEALDDGPDDPHAPDPRILDKIDKAEMQALHDAMENNLPGYVSGRPANLHAALEEFVEDIESTGGIVRGLADDIFPMAAPEWTDLAATYRHACEALGREPQEEDENG